MRRAAPKQTDSNQGWNRDNRSHTGELYKLCGTSSIHDLYELKIAIPYWFTERSTVLMTCQLFSCTDSMWLNTQNLQLGINCLNISRKLAVYEYLEWISRYFQLLKLHSNICDGKRECINFCGYFRYCIMCVAIFCDIICQNLLRSFFLVYVYICMQCILHLAHMFSLIQWIQ